MTIEELLANAQQCLVKMHEEDGDNLLAINTWANATRAYTQTAQAMILYAACSKGSGTGDAPSYSLRVLADVVMG